MRKLFVLILFLVCLLPVFPVNAADVVVTITIPDAYVPRLTAYVQATYIDGGQCEGLTLKDCFKQRMIVDTVKNAVQSYEQELARQAAIAASQTDPIEVE